MASASDLEPEKLDALLPTGPVHSLRQVQAVYGALAEAASGGSIPAGQEKYSLYFTPSELEPFVATDDDEERYLVSVQVDFTGDCPSLEGIDVTPLSPEDAPRLGLARYPWGRGIDHSITRCGSKTSGSDSSTVITYCDECLTRWTNGNGGEPAIGTVADEHPDGWLIDGLAELGGREDTQERIERKVEAQITGEPRVITTVELKLDPTRLEQPPEADEPGWFYAGEVPVFNEAMKARKTWKLVSKNIDNGTSEGEAACMITGEGGHVVGTAEDPFALFTIQHTEKFDDLDREQSWREHPVSADAAPLLDTGTGLLDACRRTRNGLGVYTLPYFTEMDEMRAELLHHVLSELQNWSGERRHPMVFLQDTIEAEGERLGIDVSGLRFYVIAIRDDQGDIFVFNENPDATIYPPREIASDHDDVLSGPTFGLTGLRRPDDWRHIGKGISEKQIVSAIIGGSYARDTVSRTGDDGAMANEPSERLAFAMLAGERVDREWLLDQYVSRLAQERDRDDENRLSKNHVLTQLAQFDALTAAGLLDGDDGRENENTMQETTSRSDEITGAISALIDAEEPTIDDIPPIADIREYQLQQFLSNRDELERNEERREAFLTGVLLGQLSDLQRDIREMEKTYADQYQAESLTTDQLEQLATRLLDKNRIYSTEYSIRMNGQVLDLSRDGMCFPETADELTKTAGNRPPEWDDISLSDMRYHLALGVTYGLRAPSRASDLRNGIKQHLETTDTDN